MQTATVSSISDTQSRLTEAEQLGEQITELCSYIYAAESRLLTLIREFDDKEHWARLGFHSCAHWLNFKCGIGMNAAREKVRVAKHGTAHHVEKLVSKYRSAKRAEDAAVANEQYRDRELSHYFDHDGCLVIKARLPAEQGALIVKALEMAMYVGAASAATDVTAETSRRIACDSTVVGIIEDNNGEPLSIGRRSRSIPPPMRRALRVRDGGCRFPGCTNSRFVDGHHIKHWADGGATSLDNLVLLCRHHHHLVHEGGFDCKKSADGEIYFTDKRQKPMPNWAELPGLADAQDIERWLDREFFEATGDGEGCAARWHAGDRMDWHMAVSALF